MPKRNAISGLNRTMPMDLAVPYTGQGGVGVPGAGGASRIAQGLQIYLPEEHPIPGSQEFNPLVSKATTIVESNIDIGLTLQLPDSNIGVIRGFSIYITNMLASTNVTWTLRVDNGPQGGFSGVSIFPRAAPSISNTFDTFIRLNSGAKVTVTYTNTDGGSYIIGASVSGWFWPEALGALWLKQGQRF